MKYLMTVEIHDGEHEYRDHAIITAKNETDARKVAQECVDAGEGEYFGFGDGLTCTELHDVRQITEADAFTISNELGLVYEITPEGMRHFVRSENQ